MTQDELRLKAEQLAPAGCATSAAVLELLAAAAAKDEVILSFGRRIVAQCEILANRAEAKS